MNAIALVDAVRPAIAYDLGAGVGRHTVPLLQDLPAGSTVVAVDLLPDALDALRHNAPDGPNELITIAADLDDFEFDRPADLVIAFSAIEHLPDLDAVTALLSKIAAAITVGGIAHLGIVCDRYEIRDGDNRTPAFLESGLSSTDANRAVNATFTDFAVIDRSQRVATVTEDRDGQPYELASTLLSITLRRI